MAMKTDPLERRIFWGYICPKCGEAVIWQGSLFSLLSSATQVACVCGKSHVRIEASEQTCTLAVPCLYCKRTHTVTCSLANLLKSKALAFSCKASGLACCYAGEEDAVTQALARLQLAADKLEEAREDGVFLNPAVMQEVLEEIKEIAGRDGISCDCGSHQWRMDVHFASAELICVSCGAALQIPAATADDIDDICCKHRILIKRV